MSQLNLPKLTSKTLQFQRNLTATSTGFCSVRPSVTANYRTQNGPNQDSENTPSESSTASNFKRGARHGTSSLAALRPSNGNQLPVRSSRAPRPEPGSTADPDFPTSSHTTHSLLSRRGSHDERSASPSCGVRRSDCAVGSSPGRPDPTLSGRRSNPLTTSPRSPRAGGVTEGGLFAAHDNLQETTLTTTKNFIPGIHANTQVLDVPFESMGTLCGVAPSITFIPDNKGILQSIRNLFIHAMRKIESTHTAGNLVDEVLAWKKYFLLPTVLFDNTSRQDKVKETHPTSRPR